MINHRNENIVCVWAGEEDGEEKKRNVLSCLSELSARRRGCWQNGSLGAGWMSFFEELFDGGKEFKRTSCFGIFFDAIERKEKSSMVPHCE
jgi:hypothetical protein